MTLELFPILDNIKKYIMVNFDPKMTKDNLNEITKFLVSN